MNRAHLFGWLSALSLLCGIPALAATVYKTVDDNGVASFSDTPPAEDVVVETVIIEAPAPLSTELTQQRLDDMRETTDRIVADRMAREKHRAELRSIELQRNAQSTAQETGEYYDETTVYTGYGPYPVRRIWRRPNHPSHPGHPIARPPLRQPAPPAHPGIRPLPGNDYPASLIRRHYDPKVRAAFQ